MSQPDRRAHAALAALIVIHAVMLAALFSGVAPHPPARVLPFAMAPFLGAVIAVAAAAAILGPVVTGPGRALALVAALLSLVSFGPHKLFDPALPQIWPALVAAWLAIGGLVAHLVRTRVA